MKFLDCKHNRDFSKLLLRFISETHAIYDCDSIFSLILPFLLYKYLQNTNILGDIFVIRWKDERMKKGEKKRNVYGSNKKKKTEEAKLAFNWYTSSSKFLSILFMYFPM